METFDITEIALLNASKTRFFVIEQAVMIEEMLSFTICKILGIDEKVSKSFGYGSEALGFNQKVILIQDKKGISKEIKMKFDVLMHIRNKFAHLKSVDSFEKFFGLSKGCMNVKKNLDKWYLKIDEKFENTEIQYKSYYYNLTTELFYYLFNLVMVHAYYEVQNNRDHELNEKFIEILQEKNAGAPITIEIWNETIKETVAALKNQENSA